MRTLGDTLGFTERLKQLNDEADRLERWNSEKFWRGMRLVIALALLGLVLLVVQLERIAKSKGVSHFDQVQVVRIIEHELRGH